MERGCNMNMNDGIFGSPTVEELIVTMETCPAKERVVPLLDRRIVELRAHVERLGRLLLRSMANGFRTAQTKTEREGIKGAWMIAKYSEIARALRVQPFDDATEACAQAYRVERGEWHGVDIERGDIVETFQEFYAELLRERAARAIDDITTAHAASTPVGALMHPKDLVAWEGMDDDEREQIRKGVEARDPYRAVREHAAKPGEFADLIEQAKELGRPLGLPLEAIVAMKQRVEAANPPCKYGSVHDGECDCIPW